VLPSFTASKLLSGVLLVTVGTPLLVLVLGSTGCADAGRGVRERAGRKRNSMGKVVEEEKKESNAMNNVGQFCASRHWRRRKRTLVDRM